MIQNLKIFYPERPAWGVDSRQVPHQHGVRTDGTRRVQTGMRRSKGPGMGRKRQQKLLRGRQVAVRL